MDKLFRHVGMVEDDNTYNEVVSDTVEQFVHKKHPVQRVESSG